MFKKRIIIDTDMGSDDYVAIQLALLSKKIKVEGISLVNGNTNMGNCINNSIKTLDNINKINDVEIYKGSSLPLKDYKVNTNDNAHGDNGFSGVLFEKINKEISNISSIDWMIDKVNNNPKKISIVCIGPLTNIAMAINKNQDFKKNVKELIIMGGAENFGNITPYAEFNFYKDPKAADIVFKSGIKDIIMIGFNVTKKVTIDKNIENILINSVNSNAKFLYDISRACAKLDREKNETDGAIINDAINICYLLDKKVLKLKNANVEIELDNKERLGESKILAGNNCKVAYDVDSLKCKKIIFKTLFPDIKGFKKIK